MEVGHCLRLHRQGAARPPLLSHDAVLLCACRSTPVKVLSYRNLKNVSTCERVAQVTLIRMFRCAQRSPHSRPFRHLHCSVVIVQLVYTFSVVVRSHC